MPGAMLTARSRPIRTVLGWQAAACALVAVLAGWAAGLHGAISALFGGAIGISGGLVFSWFASRSKATTADAVLVSALKAEAIKVLVLIALLILVLAAYRNVVVVGLIGSFILSTLIFGFAFFVRDA